jgi:uncharacterized protein (TIGR02453 family)
VRSKEAILSAETFRFFRDLGRNNSKPWMDENRQRYKQHVVEPLRRLLDALAPAAKKLHPEFCISGRTGENFSRINRDIRFASDKTPYYTHMYLFLSCTDALNHPGGQLYVGVSAQAATIGFRIYHQGRESAMACICRPRAMKNIDWLARQQKRLGGRFESYWYANEKGEWRKHPGWPREAQEWKKVKGWVMRRKLQPSTALRPAFQREVEKTFGDLFPFYCFSCLPNWKS